MGDGKAPVKTGMELRMKEPHGKGLANRSNPESCAGRGNTTGEALTGAHTGQPLSSEISLSGVPTLSIYGEGNIVSDADRKPLMNAAESETLRMCGNSMHGNREALGTPPPQDGGRFGKAHSRTPDMHVPRESDGPIVPEKRTNKAGPKAVMESVEGREPTKGNAEQALLAPDTEPGKRGIGLRGVREYSSATRGKSRMR